MTVAANIGSLTPLLDGYIQKEDIDVVRSRRDLRSFNKTTLEHLLQFVNSHGNYFQTFEVIAEVEERPKKKLLILNNSLEKNHDAFDDLSGFDVEEDIDEASRIVTELINDDSIDSLSEHLIEWGKDWNTNLVIESTIDKGSIEQDILEEAGIEAHVRLFVWSQYSRLEEWVDNNSTKYRDIADTFFSQDAAPVFLFFSSEEPWKDSPIQKYSVREFLEIDSLEVAKQAKRYRDFNWDIARMGPELPVVSPEVFQNNQCRELFDVVFVYSVLISIAEDMRYNNGELELSISTRRSNLKESYTNEELVDLADELGKDGKDSLFKFYSRFIQRGHRDVFRELWHRSITDRCSTFSDIPGNEDSIISNYEFLEEEAIESNFDDLSDAIKDAHTFTADVTSAVSETTRSLTIEIQKVVLTLLGAIFANLFLVLRWSNVGMILPFSIGVVVGVLGIYFPTIQTRIDELGDLVKESDDDFEVYANTVRGFSDSLFDFSDFEERRESYKQRAKERQDWAISNLRRMFVGLVFIWGIFAVISIVWYETLSRQYIISVLSIIPAVLIMVYHREEEYYMASLPVIKRGPSPLLILVVILILSIAVDSLFNIPSIGLRAGLNETVSGFVHLLLLFEV